MYRATGGSVKTRQYQVELGVGAKGGRENLQESMEEEVPEKVARKSPRPRVPLTVVRKGRVDVRIGACDVKCGAELSKCEGRKKWCACKSRDAVHSFRPIDLLPVRG